MPQSLSVADAQPGIFTDNQQGSGQGKIFHADLVTEANPAAPVSAGDTVVIYCSGLGAVSPGVDAGSPAPSVEPLARTVNTVTASIGGLNAHVVFAGLTPGFAGLYQVNVEVPAGVTPGDSVPVSLTVAGQSSPVVTMAVR